jgi:hypothetical protein
MKSERLVQARIGRLTRRDKIADFASAAHEVMAWAARAKKSVPLLTPTVVLADYRPIDDNAQIALRDAQIDRLPLVMG